MINQQLLTYIKNQQEAGTDNATIKDNLAQAGWRDEDIKEGFQAVSGDAGDENSPAAHREIRQEAASERGGETDNSATTNTESSEDDPYKEPITSDDQDDQNGQGSYKMASVSDSDSASDRKEDMDRKRSSTTSTNNDQGLDKASSQNLDESSVDNSGSGSQDSSTDNDGPMRVRTYERDKKIAQGQGGDLPAESTNESAKQADPQKQVDELSKEVAASVSSHRKSREKEQSQSQRKTPEEAALEAREKRAQESERNLNKSGEELATSGGMEAVTAKKSKKPTQKRKEPSSQPSRPTDAGRQRFSRGQNAAAAKKRLQQKKKSRESSSSSNLVSTMLFVLALVVVAGGAVYAYLTYYQTSTPETTAAEVMQSLTASETFNFRITIQTATDDETNEETQVIEGALDLNQETPAVSYYTLMGGQAQAPLRATMAEVENQGSIPDSQLETVQDILLTPEFFSIGEFQTTEALGAVGTSTGFTTNRYGVSVNPTQLVSDYATLHQAIFNTPLSQEVLDNLQATVSEFAPARGQTWIDPDTGAPYQITFIGTNAEGNDVQINLQFKDHGVALADTPTYEPRSFEQVLDDYFAMNSADAESESTSTPATSTATTSDEVGEETGVEQFIQARRLDQLRINDIQQISVALRVHANNTGTFPDSLNSLTTTDDGILTTIPQDPDTDNSYSYSVSADGEQYHLGATLWYLQRNETPGDANFNSRGQGFPEGFNGAAAGCQITEADPAATCYDVTGALE